MPKFLEMWTTPLGERLTRAGQGGPWVTITGREPIYRQIGGPLRVSLPAGVDRGWYYRGGWQLKPIVQQERKPTPEQVRRRELARQFALSSDAAV